MRAFVLVLCLAFAFAKPAMAQDVVSAWVKQLRLDGYSEISLRRTWLGRVRITAELDEIIREVVINPKTGEVLRDYSRHEDGTLRLPLGFEVSLDDDDDEEEEDSSGGDEDGENDGEDEGGEDD